MFDFRSIADRFDTSKSILWRCIQKAVKVTSSLSPEFIKWPSSGEMESISQQFEENSGFPGLVGSIDGCHIAIKAPTSNPESYINRKGFPSILLQGVVNNR